MTSNIFSRLTQSGGRGRSFYEQLRARDESLDVEERAGLGHGVGEVDEENLNHPFYDDDLDHAQSLGLDNSRITVESSSAPPRNERGRAQGVKGHGQRWVPTDEDVDNDVPESLLVEHQNTDSLLKEPPGRAKHLPSNLRAIPGPSTRKNRAQWETTQNQQRLHHEGGTGEPPSRSGQPKPIASGSAPGDARAKAMWRWVNVINLDHFIQDVYDYYRGCGIWCIITERALHLVNVAFVAVFLTFLTQCVDYSKLPKSTSLGQIIVPKCTSNMSWLWNLGLWLFAFYFAWKAIQFAIDMRRLWNLRDFYVHLLHIPEHDMQTISWQDVVVRIMALRDIHPKTSSNVTRNQRQWLGAHSKERLDAHDIANRLMRRENYLIALFNKDILDLSIPLPFMRNTQLLTRTLEWTLIFSILDFVFDERGQVNQEFLKSNRRAQLSQTLKSRFLFAGFMNLILAPFVACYLIIVYFLTYYNEYQKNPSALGARTYTPLAEWKFREFNELDHLFKERLNMSHPFATRYIEQFPKAKTELLARTVSFIAGSIVTVLALASLFDPEMFLSFEITPDRTVLFYLGIIGTVWAVARGTISDETSVFDPEYALRNVVEYIRYQPDHWKDRMHSFDVKKEFSELYKVKIVIFLEEILSILVTPLILFRSLPNSSDQIIDFFREFTVHVDGLGYVCSFAVFDFKKGLDQQKPAAPDGADIRDDYYSTKHGKMAASYYGFIDNYVINPKTGIPGHQPPGLRHQFNPPPAFPGLNSPTLAAEMHHSRIGHYEGARRRTGAGPSGRTPRLGAGGPPSPMASTLLDPRHQPSASVLTLARSTHRARPARGPYAGDSNIIEESGEEAASRQVEESVFESGGGLDESAWQTSPTKTLSRENSANHAEEADVGVLGLMYQFQQAHKNNHRFGGAR